MIIFIYVHIILFFPKTFVFSLLALLWLILTFFFYLYFINIEAILVRMKRYIKPVIPLSYTSYFSSQSGDMTPSTWPRSTLLSSIIKANVMDSIPILSYGLKGKKNKKKMNGLHHQVLVESNLIWLALILIMDNTRLQIHKVALCWLIILLKPFSFLVSQRKKTKENHGISIS